ncbi:ABC transporter permease [Oscillospiraceae bacterium MB08-C2-2]|nr:ABC transporter permease [Oscillospiraceae bacterium MB08-C2-2]
MNTKALDTRLNFGKLKAMAESNGPILILTILFLLSCIAFGSSFFSLFNLTNLIRQISISAIVAVGVNFVIISGGRDLSVGSVCAVASMITALLSPYGFFVAVLAGLSAGVAIGLFNGLVITRLGVQPFIATLGTQLGAKGIALLINKELSMPIAEEATLFTWVGRGYILGIPIPAYLMLLVIGGAYYVARYTKFGRAVYAIGGNEESASMMGLSVNRVKLLVYGISGLTAALAAVVLTSRLGAGLPAAGDGWDMTIMATVVIGGTLVRGGVGDMRGVLVGALICGIITNMINMLGNVNSYWQNIINGILLLIAVVMQTRSANKVAAK